MVKDPGLSTARAKPFKQGPLTRVASVMEARSLTSPALKARVMAEAGVVLSASYFALKDAFILWSRSSCPRRRKEPKDYVYTFVENSSKRSYRFLRPIFCCGLVRNVFYVNFFFFCLYFLYTTMKPFIIWICETHLC